MKAVEMSGAWETKVYKGMALPLVKESIDATDTHGTDGIGENFFPEPSRAHEEEHAVDFILNTVRNNPGKIILLALGPLTNIAAAIEKDVETMRKVKKLVLKIGRAHV